MPWLRNSNPMASGASGPCSKATMASFVLSGTKDGLVTAEASTRDSACFLPKACFFSRSRMSLAA